MTSYASDGIIGISCQWYDMMVYDRHGHGHGHMSVYAEDSALVLVMATTDVTVLQVGTRPLIMISDTCLLNLPSLSFVPGCFKFRDWYMLILLCFVPCCTWLARLNAAHLLRPKGTLGQEQGNHSCKS
jgi:hypothetical protein